MKENKTLDILKEKKKKIGNAIKNKKSNGNELDKPKKADKEKHSKSNKLVDALKSVDFKKNDKKKEKKSVAVVPDDIKTDNKKIALFEKFKKAKPVSPETDTKKNKSSETNDFSKKDKVGVDKIGKTAKFRKNKSENDAVQNKPNKIGKFFETVKNKDKIKPSKSNKFTNFIKFKKFNKNSEEGKTFDNIENNDKNFKKKIDFKELFSILKEGIKQIFSRKSINGRILNLVVVSSVCIIALITVPTAMLIVNSIQTSVKSEISTMTNTYSSYIELANDSLKESIETVGRMSQITDESMTVDERKAFLSGLCKEMTFDKLTVAGITGATIDGDSVFSQEYFSYARMGQTYLTSPTYNSSTGKNENIIAAQITNGNSAGVVIGTVDTDYFNEMIGGYKETTLHDGYCFIVDSEGKVISHYDSQLITDYAQDMDVKETAKYKRLIDKMITATEPEFLESSLNDGKDYYISYAPINNDEKWSIATVVPKSVVNREIISKLSLVILLALVLLLFVIIVGTVVAKSISKPIIDLTDRVVALSEGDLKELVPYVDTKDETLQLYQAMKSTVKNLSMYVGEIDTVLSALANKNLCVNTKADYHGDFANIKTALEKFTEELNDVMSKIKISSEQVSHGAKEMSESATNLADGATEQSKALDAVMLEISDVAQLAKNNVEIAVSTQACVSAMSESVDESSEAMNKMVDAMNRLENSSNEIKGIVSVIENIMFQTNILALNASIEASKAGSHGKGFSVVAGEIRNLSENCSGVLKRIARLIKDSINDTQNGVMLAGNVAEKLEVLVENANRTTKSVVEIADASHKQAESVEKVKNGLDKIDSVVQSNSALSEQTAAVSQELLLQANELMNNISEFKVNEKAVKRNMRNKAQENESADTDGEIHILNSDGVDETEVLDNSDKVSVKSDMLNDEISSNNQNSIVEPGEETQKTVFETDDTKFDNSDFNIENSVLEESNSQDKY